MKNKLKSMFNKGRIQVASAAVLGLSTGVVQAQQLVCVPITAQQIFTREHSQENNSCASTSFNYNALQSCTNNATYNYNVKMSQQPIDPVAAIIGTIIIIGVIYNHNKQHNDSRHDHGHRR